MSSLHGALFSILAGEEEEEISTGEFTVVSAHHIRPQRQPGKMSSRQVPQTFGRNLAAAN